MVANQRRLIFVPLAFSLSGRWRLQRQRQIKPLVPERCGSAIGGGFNWSTQHTRTRSSGRSVADDVPDQDLLHRQPEGIDVGTLEGRKRSINRILESELDG